MNPQVNDDGLNDYYSNFITEKRLSKPKKMDQRKEQYRLDSALIKKFIVSGTILDVGCSGGFFLDVMGDRYDRYGIEVDVAAINLAKKQFPSFANNISQGSLESAALPDNYFDLVIMRGVIEHVLAPEKYIEVVSKILKPGGFFYICATPNGESFSADLYRENWILFHPVQHLWHFSSKNLSILCNRHDLKLIWEEYPYLGTPYENVHEDIAQIYRYMEHVDMSVSPAFFQNMMSLVYRKIDQG